MIWSKNSVIKQTLLPDSAIASPMDNDTHYISQLSFASIDYTDAGEYTCEATYDFFGSGPTVRLSDPYLLEVKGTHN